MVVQKRKAPEEATVAAKKRKYTAKEERVYQVAKKEAAKVKKGTAAPRKDHKPRMETAQEGID